MVGRVNPEQTNGILKFAEQWTGDRPLSCPWDAFRDPFVARVTNAYRYFESGQLEFVEPHPSHRLVEGVSHYHYVNNRITHLKWERDKEARAREASVRGH